MFTLDLVPVSLGRACKLTEEPCASDLWFLLRREGAIYMHTYILEPKAAEEMQSVQLTANFTHITLH